MAIPANWYFGARSPLEEFGGFNLGNIQPVGLTPFAAPASTVSTPTAGVSGTQPGQPRPADGMSVGQQPEPTGASDGSAGPAPELDAPGMVDPGEASAAIDAALSGAHQGLIGFGLDAAHANPTISLANGDLSTSNTSGVPGPSISASQVGGKLGSLFGGPLFGLANTLGGMAAGIAQGSPTRGGNFSGVNFGNGTNNGNQDYSGFAHSLSDQGRGIDGSAGPVGTGPGGSTGANANSETDATMGGTTAPSVEVVDDPTEGQPGNEGESGGVGPAGAGPAAGASSSSGVGTGAGVSGAGIGEGEGGPGPGDGSGPGGDGGGGASGGGDGAMRKGGRAGGPRRPDPVKLANMLKSGAKVPVGSRRPGADDVGVRLSRGEEVVNKKATDVFGPILEQMNRWGNRQGGFAVGQDQTGRPRMARR